MAEAEVDAACTIFARWGGETTVRRDATSLDLLKAFEEAHIVHVAAHATFDRILLADGAFDSSRLAAADLATCRCRMLVLSACEAGKMEEPHAFLWALVRAGVNVIAATKPVDDHVCRVFFQELYGALLPTRRAAGVELAAAIRAAVARSRERTSRVADGTADPALIRRFDETVGSFLLLGDPTLNLRLHHPSGVPS